MRTITSLTITPSGVNPIVFDGTNFILSSVKGLESPKVRLPRFDLPGSSGAFISNALYSERSLQLQGYVNAPDGSRVTYLNNRTALINALSYQYSLAGTPQPVLLTIGLENGQLVQTSGYVDTPLAMAFSEDSVDYEAFHLSLVCPDPNLYGTVAITGQVGLPVGGGAAIPTAIPISLAAGSGGALTLTNIGSQPTSPTITLTAPLTNPYITNQRTGAFLKFNYTINIGDAPVVVNCATQTITQGANTLTGVISQDSTFWSLLPGQNTIGFSASAGSGTATVTFNPVFIGV
jgi:hypothetical protein